MIFGVIFVVQIVLDPRSSAAQSTAMMTLLIILSMRFSGSSEPVRSRLTFVWPLIVILRMSEICSGSCADLRMSRRPSRLTLSISSCQLKFFLKSRARLFAKISTKLTFGQQRRMTPSIVRTPRANIESPCGQAMR